MQFSSIQEELFLNLLSQTLGDFSCFSVHVSKKNNFNNCIITTFLDKAVGSRNFSRSDILAWL